MSQSNSVRLAIVGCGLITEENHLPSALRCSEVKLCALVDHSLERAQTLVRKYGLDAAAYSDMSAVLEQVDAVIIATPNHLHAAMSRTALERGVHVLVEKPMATTYQEAAGLCALARAKKLHLLVGFQTRQHPVVRLMKRLLDEGFFGKVHSFRFSYGTAGGWTPMSGYNLDRKLSGGGVLVVSGTHFLDRMLYWFGYPKSFTFSDDSYGGVEATCQADMVFESGVQGAITFSKSIDLKNTFVLHSDRYRVEIPWSESEKLLLYPIDAPDLKTTLQSTTLKGGDAFDTQLQEFARLIREGGTPTVSGEQGALSVKLCEEFYAARTQLQEPWVWYRQPELRA